MNLVKQEMGIGNEYASDELSPKQKPFPGMKPQKSKMLVSSLEEVSNAFFDHLNSGSSEEKLLKYKMQLYELEEFVANEGETLGPGWKVPISRKFTYSISPDKKISNSMMFVAKHLKKRKDSKGKEIS